MYCLNDGTEYTLAQLKADNPSVSFPASPSATLLAEYGVNVVTITDQPAIDEATQKITGYTITFVVDHWEQTWTVETKTAQEQQEYIDRQNLASDTAALKVDSDVLALCKSRPADINSYIDTNVTDLASAKETMKTMARAIAVVAQKVFLDD